MSNDLVVEMVSTAIGVDLLLVPSFRVAPVSFLIKIFPVVVFPDSAFEGVVSSVTDNLVVVPISDDCTSFVVDCIPTSVAAAVQVSSTIPVTFSFGVVLVVDLNVVSVFCVIDKVSVDLNLDAVSVVVSLVGNAVFKSVVDNDNDDPATAIVDGTSFSSVVAVVPVEVGSVPKNVVFDCVVINVSPFVVIDICAAYVVVLVPFDKVDISTGPSSVASFVVFLSSGTVFFSTVAVVPLCVVA